MFGVGRKELQGISAVGDAIGGKTARRDDGSWREGFERISAAGDAAGGEAARRVVGSWKEGV